MNSRAKNPPEQAEDLNAIGGGGVKWDRGVGPGAADKGAGDDADLTIAVGLVLWE